MKSLHGKIAIVTGAGSGVGRATALALAEEGATTVLVGRRVAPLEEVAGKIRDAGGEATVHSADLCDGETAAGVASFTLERHGQIDIVVNNAGFSSKVRSVRFISPEEWDAVFKINMDAVYRLSQACLPHMLDRQEGTIITVSSMAALKPSILGGSPYSAAKAAVLAFMRELSSELREKGIRACTICPAEINTPILDGRPMPPDEAARQTMMDPEDVASAILLCATMPKRTVIDEIVMSPTIPRDMTAEIEFAHKKRS